MPKCSMCRKSLLGKCKCFDNPREKASNKTPKTLGGEAPPASRADARGNDWCTACDCRVLAGRCSNVTCSTNK